MIAVNYLLYITLVWVLISVIYMLRVKGKGLSTGTGILQLCLLPVFSFVCAKLLYVLLLFSKTWSRHGIASLWQLQPETFSFLGGCIGACLAVLAGAKLTRQASSRYADLFAGPGALAIALLRLAEGLFPDEMFDLGLGSWIEHEQYAFFPLSVQMDDTYRIVTSDGEWFLAVFLWSAVLSLAVGVISLILSRKPAPEGQIFRRTVFGLALVQIIPESFRALSMKWGFVRIEQVLCAVIILLLLVLSCRKSIRPFKQTVWIPLLSLLGFGICVAVEIALDKSSLSFLLLYGIMLLTLIGQFLLEHYAIRHETKIE